MSYLGIDIGTSAVKAVLIDDDQDCIFQSAIPLKISRPKEIWSEQNPDEWWQAVCSLIEAIKNQHSHEITDIKAISLTGQMHGATCIDKNNRPLRPAILWNDGRSHAECDILNAHPANFKKINGNTVMPGFTAPKLLWLQRNELEVFKKIYKVLLPKDYISCKLSGEYSSDLSDASGTAWLDVGNRCWSEDLLAATNLTMQHMPKVYEGIELTGWLNQKLAAQWRMPKNVKIIAGAGDNAAGAISCGIIESNRAMLSLGTSGVYFVPTEKFNPDPNKGFHTFCHCIPNTWHQMGVILSAASCLSWWLNVTGAKDEHQLLAEAQTADFKHVPIFLPYLSGERTPHNDPFAKGMFFGITHNTSRPELTQAILEGVAFAIADCQKVLKESGTDAEHISVVGGGAKSRYWGVILSNVLNKTLCYHNESLLGPSFGAARLAMLGDLNKPIASVAKVPNVTDVIAPDKNKHEHYAEKFVNYQKIYQQLKSLFK